jgi:RNA polymerase sigma-54 factor
MLQSIEVLQLATQDLLKLIDAEVEQNETLEATSKLDAVGEGEAMDRSAEREDDHGEESAPDLRAAPDSGERDRNLDLLHSIAAAAGNLLDSIKEQLAWLDLPCPLRDKVLALAERLDERGLLASSDAELEQALGQELLAEAIRVVQCLEPRGIGARDPIGAMLLQLDPDDPDYADIEKLLTIHLEELARNKLPRSRRPSAGRSTRCMAWWRGSGC